LARLFFAPQDCGKELAAMNGDISKLSRLLETCPRDGHFIVSLDNYSDLIQQLGQSLDRTQVLLQQTRAAVIDRWQQWKRYEDSANAVVAFIKRLNYARNMASPGRGSFDLHRLQAAKISMEVSSKLLYSSYRFVSFMLLLETNELRAIQMRLRLWGVGFSFL
jgi:hypothetical protein